MPVEITNGGTVCTGDGIDLFRMLALKGRLHLEIVGLKFRGGSTYAYVKREFGLKGSKQSVYEQFCKLCDEQSAKVERVDRRTEHAA